MKNKLSVAFLWHMHQPMYKDLLTGKYHLPWVRLHSTYSYLDMISILEKFPEAKVTFNLTASLLWQLIDISKSDKVDDIYLSLSEKNAADLDETEKAFLLKNFFSCDLDKAIAPIEKYKKLYERRGDDLSQGALLAKTEDFSTDDFRDLQVFFNLAWCGFTLKGKDQLVKNLFAKAANYSEAEKLALLKRQKEVVASIIPLYKKSQDEGKIEIATSPFYHPILPLLCENPFDKSNSMTEDAKIHVKKAVDLYDSVFGHKPQGMWPSEGSVSQEIIPILEAESIEWIATDEGILLESFRGEGIHREDLIYKAFTAEEKNKRIDMVFRDVNLSNAISFKYSKMPAKRAAADFLSDIQGIYKFTSEKEKTGHIVSVILDGENPWPYYEDGGKTFLEEVYSHILNSQEAELVTISGYLKNHKERGKIKELHSGSWIDRNFNKWIGSPQKDKAWEYLNKTRREMFLGGEPPSAAMEELYIAEGSDWFWWYDDFGTELNFVFDDLFRMHLANIYTLMGREVPYYLLEPIKAAPVAKTLTWAAEKGEMARTKKVLIVSPEAIPFAKTGGLADVAGSLAKTLVSFGVDVRLVVPLYRCVRQSGFELVKELEDVKYPLQGSAPAFNIYSNKTAGLTTYFVDNRRFFNRETLYGTSKGDFPDNGWRYGCFCKSALATIEAMDFRPDIIHCNDWQTALIPFYLKFTMQYKDFFRDIKTLFTIHNMAYQGIFPKKIMSRLGIPQKFFNMHDLEFYGKVNFMKSGILYSNAVSTVSHKYASEIMTPEYGAGLDGLLRTKKEVLYGIPNGVDYSIWSPKNDKFIVKNYDIKTIELKTECKKDLLKSTHLTVPFDRPLIGAVTRLAHQKGMDLFAKIVDRLVKLNTGIVILGSGDEYYNRIFVDIMERYPRNVYVCFGFNDELAHKIEAGCDMFVMPSRYEPCGLNQMYSIKYGTIPVVRATGGLDDVIVDFDEDRENGNGFKFGSATEDALYRAIERAIDLYSTDKKAWQKLMFQAMSYDFSWERSTKQYLALYGKLSG
ncbi:MAG: glycogen synthase GlgA [Candidatus Omnitrophica bacterium]|nr:glycogen synthase GlgA [Candidatus Omnitrophota bacterium]